MIIFGSTHGLSDTENFIASLDQSLSSLPAGWRNLFHSRRELIVTRAPGRLDLMGGIADYSGSLVLQWPIQDAVHVALQRNKGKTLRIASLLETQANPCRCFEIDLEEFESSADYSIARARFAGDPANHWAAYVAGAIPVLMRERNAYFNEGAHIFIKSAVPEGKGVSSSAALEVASMQAVAAAYELEISAPELALLCQKVENYIVGAPCGVMDQMTAACGETNRLLELWCQPAELKSTIPLPKELEIWGIDSGIRHSVGGSDYRTVRTAAFMGYRIIADVARLSVRRGERDGQVQIDDPKWKGYLANVTPDEFERCFATQVPELFTGADFLKQYDGITDTATSVDVKVVYPVAAATRHPIYEDARVRSFAGILKDWRPSQACNLGELMFQSHDSYSRCGLDSAGTDALVGLVREAASDHLYGAKITGGGSGGTVAVLGRRGAGDVVQKIAEFYRQKTGYQPTIISGSSPGANVFGQLRLTQS
jgi:L-arabinokinase